MLVFLIKVRIMYFYRYFNNCGVTDPSWTDLRHFLWFLNAQLEDCESSVFCKASWIADTLPGLKKFVVQFMLKMSQVLYVCNYKLRFILMISDNGSRLF